MKKPLLSIVSALLLTVGSVASAAPVFLDFTVNPSSTGTNNKASFVADKINGGYSEAVYISPTGQVQAAAYADFGAFFANQGASIVNATGLANDYGLYALFTSNAQVVSATNFLGLGGTIELWIDRNMNTTKSVSFSGDTPIVQVTGGSADDYKLATSTDMRIFGASYGSLTPPPAFDFIFDNFSLTNVDADGFSSGNQSGAGFFIGPVNFHMIVEIDGNVIGLNTAPGKYGNVTGAANVTFTDVPEPASLALAGLALLAAAGVRRRRK